MEFRLLFADDALLVVHKPSGLLSVPGRGADKQDCLSHRVQQQFADALIVHRLDMATSGLMVLARGLDTQRRLNAAFSERQVAKRYVAVVCGQLGFAPDTWHAIDLPIAVDWPNRPLRVIDAQQGKPSTTRLRVIAHDPAGNTTRVALEPITGRSHQLRVHLQALGHPILGDTLYAPLAVQAMAPRLLLHAEHLAFAHPVDGHPLQFDDPAEF